MLPGSDRNSADWTPWNTKTQAAILCRSYTVLLNVPFFFTPGPHPAWALGGPRTWSQQPNHRRWPPWPSRRQKAPQHHTTPTFSKSSATQLPVHFSRKCFPGAQGFGAEPLRAICGNCANLSPANANKTPRGQSTKNSDATGLIKRPEINTKTSLPREHEQVLEPQRR